jgi:predicted PurR-regulated permease PerM
MIIVAALIGGSFGGLVGAFLAIPAAGCLKVLIDFYIKENYTIQKPNLAKKD